MSELSNKIQQKLLEVQVAGQTTRRQVRSAIDRRLTIDLAEEEMAMLQLIASLLLLSVLTVAINADATESLERIPQINQLFELYAEATGREFSTLLTTNLYLGVFATGILSVLHAKNVLDLDIEGRAHSLTQNLQEQQALR